MSYLGYQSPKQLMVQLMVKTAAKEETVEVCARVLARHHCVVNLSERLRLREEPSNSTRSFPSLEGKGKKYPWYNPSQPRLPYASISPLTKARYGYISSEQDYDGYSHDDAWWNESEGWNSYYVSKPAPESCLSQETPEHDQDMDPDLVEALNAYASVQADAGLADLGEDCAEAV